MRFNDRSEFKGRHAVLSASKGQWLNYDDDKFDRVIMSQFAAKRGTDLHALAAECVRLGQILPDNGTTMSLYVNDCIGWRMKPELTLFYSPNAFGTPDAIGFREKILRISDLKTGITHTTVRQLQIYGAYFCLEYGINPFEIEFELRIYQNDDVELFETLPGDIFRIMEKIIDRDKRISQLREEAE